MLPLLVALQFAAAPPSADTRIGRLQVWLEAAEAHEPGAEDEAMARVRAMKPAALDQARIDLRAVIALMRDPRATLFYGEQRLDSSAGRVRPIIYTDEELKVLRTLAREASMRGTGTRLLKLAALLHADLAMSADRRAMPAGTRRLERLERTVAWVADGEQVGLVTSVDHLDMGRRLLADIEDDDVRLWYQATTAFLQRTTSFQQAHFDAALQRFPLDATILFLVGSMREAIGSPVTNWSLRSARGVDLDIGSEERELHKAEALFRRALAVDATHVEARLRLGHVLAQLGQSAEASKELRTALTSTLDPLLVYYGLMYYGRRLEEDGDPKTAGAAYERAASIAPAAPSPRLSLSRLAAQAGHRQASLSWMREAVQPTINEGDEPLWVYHPAAGRAGETLVAAMRQRLAAAR